jgi:hypothetical protein
LKQFLFELRSMPGWLIEEYLLELGGKLAENNWILGSGWKASIEKMSDFQIGSLRVGQVRLEWWGDENAILNILPVLEQKLMRAGG